jgi:hypothetical protein
MKCTMYYTMRLIFIKKYTMILSRNLMSHIVRSSERWLGNSKVDQKLTASALPTLVDQCTRSSTSCSQSELAPRRGVWRLLLGLLFRELGMLGWNASMLVGTARDACGTVCGLMFPALPLLCCLATHSPRGEVRLLGAWEERCWCWWVVWGSLWSPARVCDGEEKAEAGRAFGLHAAAIAGDCGGR